MVFSICRRMLDVSSVNVKHFVDHSARPCMASEALSCYPMKGIKDIRRENLLFLVDKAGGQAELARKLNRDRNQVYQWLLDPENKAARGITDKTARMIEKACGLEHGSIDTPKMGLVSHEPGAGKSGHFLKAFGVSEVTGEGDAPSDAIEIRHMEVEAHAGDGDELTFAPTQFPMYYRTAWFLKEGAKPENVRSMRVSGSSMEPVLWDGDRIAIDFGHTHIQDDRVYVIRLDGATLVKRLFRHAGGVRVVSDNPDKVRYPDSIVDADDMNDRLRVYGLVIDKSGRGGL